MWEVIYFRKRMLECISYTIFIDRNVTYDVTLCGEYDRCIHPNQWTNEVTRNRRESSCAIGLKSTWIEKFHLSSPEVSFVFRESYPDKLLHPGKYTERYIVIIHNRSVSFVCIIFPWSIIQITFLYIYV